MDFNELLMNKKERKKTENTKWWVFTVPFVGWNSVAAQYVTEAQNKETFK